MPVGQNRKAAGLSWPSLAGSSTGSVSVDSTMLGPSSIFEPLVQCLRRLFHVSRPQHEGAVSSTLVANGPRLLSTHGPPNRKCTVPNLDDI